jgi:hypothetical protein
MNPLAEPTKPLRGYQRGKPGRQVIGEAVDGPPRGPVGWAGLYSIGGNRSETPPQQIAVGNGWRVGSFITTLSLRPSSGRWRLALQRAGPPDASCGTKRTTLAVSSTPSTSGRSTPISSCRPAQPRHRLRHRSDQGEQQPRRSGYFAAMDRQRLARGLRRRLLSRTRACIGGALRARPGPPPCRATTGRGLGTMARRKRGPLSRYCPNAASLPIPPWQPRRGFVVSAGG